MPARRARRSLSCGRTSRPWSRDVALKLACPAMAASPVVTTAGSMSILRSRPGDLVHLDLVPDPDAELTSGMMLRKRSDGAASIWARAVAPCVNTDRSRYGSRSNR